MRRQETAVCQRCKRTFTFIPYGRAGKYCGHKCYWEALRDPGPANEYRRPPGIRKQYWYEFRSWAMMRERCLSLANHAYKDYGGRGIMICERWSKFENFFTDMGPKPSRKHSIERIDNNKGYEPGNCKWATALEQANNKRNNVFLTWDGETRTTAEWSRHTGISTQLLWHRLNTLGWSVERALTVRPDTRWTGRKRKPIA